jgi:hypothetical protein
MKGSWGIPAKAIKRLVSAALAFFTLTLYLPVAIAGAGCSDWTNVNKNGDSPWIYAGTVADRQIRMLIQYDPATREVSGTYGYNDQPGELSLSGALSADGTALDLEERDSSGVTTGHFNLVFVYPTWQPGWDSFGKKSDWDCMFLNGTWQANTTSSPLKVAVSRQDAMQSTENEKRKKNEVIAYQLQRAILTGDHKKFASLLKYPFWSASVSKKGKVITRIWNTPAEVIKNYDQIMTMPVNYVQHGVPHELETDYEATSSFLDGNVCIKDEKVHEMCSAGCASRCRY